jgi:hypothetical protein
MILCEINRLLIRGGIALSRVVHYAPRILRMLWGHLGVTWLSFADRAI